MKNARGQRRVSKTEPGENFDRVLLDAIDEALSSLGEDAKVSIYSHFEDLFKIIKQEIPSRLNDFSNALEQIFGLAARHLEILFMKNLHAKIEVTFKWPTYGWRLPKRVVSEMTFQEYVRLMRQSFEAAGEETVKMGILVNEHEELQK